HGHLLLRRARGPGPGEGVRHHPRRAVPGVALVPRARDDEPHQVELPERGVLPPPARGAGAAVGGLRLAVRARQLARADRAAARLLPRRRRGRRVRVPGAARGRGVTAGPPGGGRRPRAATGSTRTGRPAFTRASPAPGTPGWYGAAAIRRDHAPIVMAMHDLDEGGGLRAA